MQERSWGHWKTWGNLIRWDPSNSNLCEKNTSKNIKEMSLRPPSLSPPSKSILWHNLYFHKAFSSWLKTNLSFWSILLSQTELSGLIPASAPSPPFSEHGSPRWSIWTEHPGAVVGGLAPNSFWRGDSAQGDRGGLNNELRLQTGSQSETKLGERPGAQGCHTACASLLATAHCSSAREHVQKHPEHSSPADALWSTLRSRRRARSLCVKEHL